MASFTILEPMSTGDVIDRAVRLYRRNFVPLISIVAVPTVIGYVVSLMFWYGYTSLITRAASANAVPVTAVWMLALGGLGYPVWGFAMLLTIAGLSRVVGDHVMLDEPISFRRCVRAIKRRLGAIVLMGLLTLVLLFVVYFALTIVLFVLVLVFSLLIGAIAAAQLPQWVTVMVMTITVVVAVALGLLLICVVTARLIFLPQIVMIEGESAGNAVGRAIRLGKGNWYRVAAIMLFSYFINLSLLEALTLPVIFGLYLAGVMNAEFWVSPTWSVLYTSFRDVSGLLSLPIWIVSFTLLYFDSRVRKEAYDVDLLAREINPGFYWQARAQPTVLGYQMPVQPSGRAFVQTSPLGLAGYQPPRSQAVTSLPQEPSSESEQLRDKFERAAERLGADPRADVSETRAACRLCGTQLVEGARFCMRCGSPIGAESSST